jgi:sec-independent protein translocase protein TatA
MGPIGWPELVLILVVLLVIFGPGKLPQVGEAIGKGIRELRRASSDLEDAVRGTPPRPGESQAPVTDVPAPEAAAAAPDAAPPAEDERRE